MRQLHLDFGDLNREKEVRAHGRLAEATADIEDGSMERRGAALLTGLTVLAGVLSAEAGRSAEPSYGEFKMQAGTAQRPGDPEAATAKEFRAAQAQGTREALVRFIARHPDHPLAEEARARLDARTDFPGAEPGSADLDSEVYAAFDDARGRNTADAYEAFIRRYGSHPLASEAQRLHDRIARDRR